MKLFSSYSHYAPGFGGIVMLFVMFLLGSVLGSIVTMVLQVAVSQEFATQYGTLFSYPVMFVPPMLYAAAKSRSNSIFGTGCALDSNNFGKYGGPAMALIVSVTTIATAFVVEPVTALLPDMPLWLEELMDQMLDAGPVWATLISVSVFAPFFEEWLCRGIVLRGLLGRTSPLTAITVSAAFFAILHMNPWQAIPAFCLGLLFGYVYYKTGSLKLTMLMHCVNNTMAVLLSQFPSMKEADTLMDVMSPWAYAGAYTAFILIVASAIVILHGIPSLSACRKGPEQEQPS